MVRRQYPQSAEGTEFWGGERGNCLFILLTSFGDATIHIPVKIERYNLRKHNQRQTLQAGYGAPQCLRMEEPGIVVWQVVGFLPGKYISPSYLIIAYANHP